MQVKVVRILHKQAHDNWRVKLTYVDNTEEELGLSSRNVQHHLDRGAKLIQTERSDKFVEVKGSTLSKPQPQQQRPPQKPQNGGKPQEQPKKEDVVRPEPTEGDKHTQKVETE